MLDSSGFVLILPRRARRRLLPFLSVLVMSVGLGAGCHKGGGATEDTAARLRKLLNPLGDYVEATIRHGTGRPNEEGFKAYLASLSKQKLGDLQITNIHDLLVSPRDQKPFVINYDIPISGGSTPTAWEQTGQNGRRYILYQDAKVEEIDDEAFSRIGPKSKK